MPQADGWDRREIKLGISNDKLIEVKEGLCLATRWPSAR